jgi:hypothetical protein
MPRFTLLLLPLTVVPACTFSEKVVNHYHYYGDTGGEEGSGGAPSDDGGQLDSGAGADGADGSAPLPDPVIWTGTLFIEERGTPLEYALVLATQPPVEGALYGPITTVESAVLDVVVYDMTLPLTLTIEGTLEDDGAAAGIARNDAPESYGYQDAWTGGLTTSGPEGTTLEGEGYVPLVVFGVPTPYPFRFAVSTPAR